MARTGTSGPDDPGRVPLSPLIHGRVRLLILSALARSPRAHPFTALRDALGLTDGSLSANLSKLEEGGLVSTEKTFEGKRPLTLVRLTDTGRREFRRYLDDLRTILPDL